MLNAVQLSSICICAVQFVHVCLAHRITCIKDPQDHASKRRTERVRTTRMSVRIPTHTRLLMILSRVLISLPMLQNLLCCCCQKHLYHDSKAPNTRDHAWHDGYLLCDQLHRYVSLHVPAGIAQWSLRASFRGLRSVCCPHSCSRDISFNF